MHGEAYDTLPATMTTREIGALRLGAVPVTVEPKAAELLAQLRPEALDAVLSGVREWAEHAPVKCARLTYDLDPEATFWEQAIIEIDVEADTDQAFDLWEDVGAALEGIESRLPAADRDWLLDHFDVHLHW